MPGRDRHIESLVDYIPFRLFTAPYGQQEFERLGYGSFGSVLGGELFGTPVALKEVRPTTEYDVHKYFDRELDMLRNLRHPNIIQYMGITRSPAPTSHVYMVTERITNGTLAQRVTDHSLPFPWPWRLSLATDAARALSYIHDRGCLHRDVKGDNLLITTLNRAKVCDFGFARVAAGSASEMRAISFLGTSAYMAPELLLGEDYTFPADTFSFGVMLCEIACRTLATDLKRAGKYHSIDTEQVKALTPPKCPRELLALALKCTLAVPAERPPMSFVVGRLNHIETVVAQRNAGNGGGVSGSTHPFWGLVPKLDLATMQARIEQRAKRRQVAHLTTSRIGDTSLTSLHDSDATDIGVARHAPSSSSLGSTIAAPANTSGGVLPASYPITTTKHSHFQPNQHFEVPSILSTI